MVLIMWSHGVDSDIEHAAGKPKSTWGKEGHKGQILVQYPPSLQGLEEADRLHEHFEKNGRSRKDWCRIQPFWHGLPGHDDLEEGPDFLRIDKETQIKQRVFYGYLATAADLDKVQQPINRKRKRKVNVLTRAQIQAHSVPGNKTIVIWSESSAEIEACSVPGNKMVVLGQRMPMERSLRLKVIKGSNILWASKVQKLSRLHESVVLASYWTLVLKRDNGNASTWKSTVGCWRPFFTRQLQWSQLESMEESHLEGRQTSNESKKLAFIVTWTSVL